ncbi:MAG: hypothetical protein KF768_11520 [Phycisphaeraceae bacterium]|nr:hypothetical protein [Phycisphaeraceae bacterium]
MHTSVFRYQFASGVDPLEAEATLQLAILAVEGLVGEARVRMDVSYLLDAPRSVIVVDGSTPTSDALVRIYTALITREFGAESFRVRRMTSPPSKPASAAIGAAA